MNKIKGLDVYFQNLNNDDLEASNKIHVDITNMLGQVDIEKYTKKNFWSWVAILIFASMGAAFLALFLVNMVVALVLVAIFGCLAIGALFVNTRNRRDWFNEVNSKISFFELCKSHFENHYENVKVLAESNVDINMVNTFKGKGIASDATILKVINGFVFLVDGIEVHTASIVWHWYTYVSNGKTTIRNEVKRVKFVSYVPSIPPRWKGFELSLSTSSLFDNKGKELENEKFNKMFSYSHNDPVRLRVLFTPFIQEVLVNYFHQTSAERSFDLDIRSNALITSKDALGGNPFKLDRAPFGKKVDVAKKIYQEIKSDFAYLEEQITILSTMRELIVDR